MIPYFLHSAVLIVLLYLAYHFLLSKETFFRANRYILIFGIAVGFTLPVIEIPREWSVFPISLGEVITAMDTHSSVNHTTIHTNKNLYKEDIRLNAQENLHASPIERNNAVPENEDLEIVQTLVGTASAPYKKLNLKAVFYAVYLIGTAFFALLFALQLSRIAYFYFTGKRRRDGTFRIVENKSNASSFSFLSLIFISHRSYDRMTYKRILEHEKIHVRSVHSIDMLLAQILVIVQWLNPFAWLYKNAIENNLEFITDRQMLVNGTDQQDYQLSLLRVAAPNQKIALTNKYNQS